MAICDRRHANMSKQTTLADIDQTPSCGVPFPDASPLIKQYQRATEVLAQLGSFDIDVTQWFGLRWCDMVCQQSDQEQNIFVNLKPFDMKDLYVFMETLIM